MTASPGLVTAADTGEVNAGVEEAASALTFPVDPVQHTRTERYEEQLLH